MGIQGLQSFLESYGRELLLPQDGTQAWLVIDGNALAHHIYNEANILEGHYRSYAKAILAFMDKIKVADVQVLQICFDGTLPAHKTPVRQERVRRSMKLNARNVGALDAWVPAPGLASFICQQVLSDAGYPVTTSPEEADLTCARTAGAFASHAGPTKQIFILSQDSDMHLFDLGPAAAYMPLNTVTFSDDKMSGHAFFYAQTSASLGVDVLELGTMMGTEGSTSKHASARLCINKLQTGHLRQHVMQGEILRSAALFDWTASPVSSTLDVYAQKNKPSGILMELLSTGNLYLPLLLENVKRDSIWRCSRGIRAQAYHHIQDLLPPRKHHNERGVTEWLRAGTDLASEFVAATGTRTIDVPETGLSDEAVFVIAVQLLEADCKTQGKPMQPCERDALIIMFLGTFKNTTVEIDLNVIHLTARYASLVFSLILLLECKGVIQRPLLHKLYDLGTFLVAHRFLSHGTTLAQLAPGKEAEIERIRHQLA